jgi:Nif-specific regulatory protein
MRYGEQRVAWKTRVLFDYAERHGFSSAVKQLGNNVAAVLWSQGKYREETAFVEKLLAKYEFLSSEQIQISLYTNLGQSYGDRSQFGKAISAFRKAQSLSASDTNWGRQGYAHSSLIAAYTASSKFRLALAEAETLYEKSTRWADRLARTTYNINMGQILLARGQLKSALRYLKLGEELARVNHARFERTSALLFLTRGYRWHGDIESLKRDLPRLRALMPTAVDWRLNLHVDLSELWLEAHETGNLRVDRVRALIKEAARHERALEYAEGLFLLAEFGHDREAFKMRNHSKEIWKIFRKKRAPRYAGFYYLIRALSGKAEKDTTYRLNQLNRAVDCFRNAEARYHASVVALRLIRCYREASAMTRAQNVLNWARVSTEPLDNHLLEAELDQEGDLIRKIVGPDTTNMTLLSRIGDVLTSLHNYRRTLEILLRNAVNLTGAERGAIVLTHSDEIGLKVEISHACDEVSEKDILKISNSSISRTLEREAGLIVHDAQRDKLTSGFKSVKMHNIVSIACVPLKVRGRLLGALYLDHRSIPALFGEKNYEVIEALAKFMAVAIEIARDVKRGDAERSYAAEKLESLGASVGFLAVDNRSRGVLAQIPKIASFDTTVLLQGESGTGKGLLAEAIHNQSRRSHGPFIALNCSHLRGENGMYELFGVSERAFTGVSAREGRIERADGGTLFLDEIADMPMETQAILLDVIESKKIMRSGSTEQISVDFRLICATNANLEALAARNRFRSDLFYRISAFVIRVPPLRERSDDIEPLVKHLLSVLPGSAPNLSYTRRFIDALKAYEWPGNVRELRNEIERVLILRNGSRLDFDLLNPAIARSSDKLGSTALDKHLEKVERDLIESALKRTNGNVTAAALILRLAPSTLRSRLQKLGIDPDQFTIN